MPPMVILPLTNLAKVGMLRPYEGVVESRWAPRSSKPSEGCRRGGPGGFDSHPLP